MNWLGWLLLYVVLLFFALAFVRGAHILNQKCEEEDERRA